MQVRGKNKMFTEAADKNHSHSNYALTNHTHGNYISRNDIAIVQIGGQLSAAAGGIPVNYPQGFDSQNCVPISILFASNDKPNQWNANVFLGTDHEYLFHLSLGNRMLISYRSLDGGGSLDDAKHEGKFRIILLKTSFVL
ncbi:hypothetical protein [Bacteroides caecimuris]|jgi:hypothetical protein|uniref:hypothetical protein n=1 Tax=Bacteroides caecimuris TaxID=1796613 RepID=UPI00257106B9|nr:hypothetical protein [Bacteroides caecimuris]